MAQSFFPITPVEITPPIKDSWQTVNLDSYIPLGSTGIIFHLVGQGATAADFCGLRKPGSTDNRRSAVPEHCWGMIGCNASRQVQIYVGANPTIYLCGYTNAGVTFLLNGININPALSAVWTDTDLVALCPLCAGALGIIVEVDADATQFEFGIRMRGSTDNRPGGVDRHGCFGAIIGCDLNQHIDIYVFTPGVFHNVYLIGFITDGATFFPNAVDTSIAVLGAFEDLLALPADAVMGFIEIYKTPIGASLYALRQKGGIGADKDIYDELSGKGGDAMHDWSIVESSTIEGKKSTAGIEFWYVGYANGPAAPPAPPVPPVTSKPEVQTLPATGVT